MLLNDANSEKATWIEIGYATRFIDSSVGFCLEGRNGLGLSDACPLRVVASRSVVVKEALIYSHMAATVAWRDEMQGVARSQGLFSLTRDTTQQFARQAPSRRACFARYQRGGCGQIEFSLSCTAWHRSPGYDLRRTRRDLPDLASNAAHGGINQRFPKGRHLTTLNLTGRSSQTGLN